MGVVVEFIFLRIANKAITISREVEGYKVVEWLELLGERLLKRCRVPETSTCSGLEIELLASLAH